MDTSLVGLCHIPSNRILTRLHGARIVDLDLTIVLPDLNVRKRRERIGELLMEDIALQREGRSVTRAVEASLSLVVTQQADFGACTLRKWPRGCRCRLPRSRRSTRSRTRDLTLAEIGRVEDRLPVADVGNELLCGWDRRRGIGVEELTVDDDASDCCGGRGGGCCAETADDTSAAQTSGGEVHGGVGLVELVCQTAMEIIEELGGEALPRRARRCSARSRRALLQRLRDRA